MDVAAVSDKDSLCAAFRLNRYIAQSVLSVGRHSVYAGEMPRWESQFSELVCWAGELRKRPRHISWCSVRLQEEVGKVFM